MIRRTSQLPAAVAHLKKKERKKERNNGITKLFRHASSGKLDFPGLYLAVLIQPSLLELQDVR